MLIKGAPGGTRSIRRVKIDVILFDLNRQNEVTILYLRLTYFVSIKTLFLMKLHSF